MDKESTEAYKELARVLVLAVIPVAIMAAEAGAYDWRWIAIALLIAVLRALEKWLHSRDSKMSLPF